jgi:hypothetical protein
LSGEAIGPISWRTHGLDQFLAQIVVGSSPAISVT